MNIIPHKACNGYECGKPLTGNQARWCSHLCASRWHNKQKHWTERIDQAKQNAIRKAKYEADPETWRAKTKAWREANPKQYRIFAERAKERYRLAPWRKLIIAAKGRAKVKGLPCDLTFSWGEATWTGFCELTGLPFVNSVDSPHRLFSPSIDQIEPKKGYTQANSRFVLLAVNNLKHDGSDEAMYFVAEALINNRPNTLLASERRTLQIIAVEPADRLGGNDVVAADHHALLADLAERHE
jgi:hypothetical protein